MTLSSKLKTNLETSEKKTYPPHLIVQALAGTGKTTTLIEGLNLIFNEFSGLAPSPQQKAVWDSMALSYEARSACFVAFNKSIATELQKRVPTGCDAMTMHSMGFKAVKKTFTLNFRKAVNSSRLDDIISELLDKDIRNLRRHQGDLLKATKNLVSLCKMTLIDLSDPSDYPSLSDAGFGKPAYMTDPSLYDKLSQLADHYEVELNGSQEKVFGLVPKVLERCLDVDKDGCIDYDDMIWLPIVLNLKVPKYDLLLVDEAQDLNRCQQALALKAGHRLILCGDVNQAIYGFAGADAESMARMAKTLGVCMTCGGTGFVKGKTHLNDFPCAGCDERNPANKDRTKRCQILPLTVTRRCSKAVVREAQKIVPKFEAHESNCEGLISKMVFKEKYNAEASRDNGLIAQGLEPEGDDDSPCDENMVYHEYVEDGDMVLCRVNGPLVSECFKFIRAGRKANIQGKDVGAGLISTINKMKANDLNDLQVKLSDWLHAEIKKENNKRNPNETRIIAMQDRYDCISCFMDPGFVTGIESVIERIKSIFTDDKKTTGIKLSSGHKSKGLEADRVFILDVVPYPHPMAKTKWQLEQESNLRYVMITRAKSELVFVS